MVILLKNRNVMYDTTNDPIQYTLQSIKSSPEFCWGELNKNNSEGIQPGDVYW